MKKQLALTFLFLALFIGKALGWGSGHDDQTRLMFEMLPSEIQAMLSEEQRAELIRHYSHFPDSGGDLDPEKIGEKGYAFAVGHNVKGVYGFHGSKGKATAFVLLTRAFAENDPDLAALWMGTIVHSIGDEAACNHDPLVSYITYAFKAYGIPMEMGTGLDYSDVAKTEEGKAVVAELAKNFKPAIISENPEEALRYLLMSEAEGNAFMTSRGATIAAAYKPAASEQTVAEARRALAELGQYGAERAANVILTAWHYAKQGKAATLDFDEELLKKAEEAEKAFIAARSLSSDSIFTGLLDGAQSGPAVGVLIEPSQKMNRTYLGFSSKYISAAAMRAMKENGIPWRAVDLRTMDPENPPTVADMPVMMVCSGGARLPQPALDALKIYVKEGGKLLWIGGRDSGLLGDLSKSLAPADDADLPVLGKYGAGNDDTIKKASMLFKGPLAAALSAEPFPFLRNPNTKAGWQKPYCPYQIDVTRPNLKPLAILKVGEKTFPVAAALEDAGETAHVFIPEYLVAPFLLTPALELQDVSMPLFDSVGAKVFLSCLKALDSSFAGKSR